MPDSNVTPQRVQRNTAKRRDRNRPKGGGSCLARGECAEQKEERDDDDPAANPEDSAQKSCD